MQTIDVLDIKPFMQLLFQNQGFDTYTFLSASVKTDMSYEVDGHLNSEFFTEEERLSLQADDPSFMSWLHAKEKIFQLIKGKKTPTILKVVLKADSATTTSICQSTQATLSINDIDGMYVNILFQNGKLNIVCGISYKIFTLDKQLEQELTSHIQELLKSNQITCQ